MINTIFVLLILWKLNAVRTYTKKVTPEHSNELFVGIKKAFPNETDATVLSSRYVRLHFVALFIKALMNLVSFAFIVLVVKTIPVSISILSVICLFIYFYYYAITFQCLKRFFFKDKNKHRKKLTERTYDIVYAKYFNYIRNKRYSWIAIYAHVYCLFISFLVFNK